MIDDRKSRLELLLKQIGQGEMSLNQANKELSKYPAKLVFDGKKRYELLKSDGVTLSHTGWFINSKDTYNVSELFFTFSKIILNYKEYEMIVPYLLIFNYDKNKKIIDKSFVPLDEMDKLELGAFIAKISKKTISDSSIPTQIDLETVIELLEKDTDADVNELFSKIKEKISNYIKFSNLLDEDVIVLWIISTYFSDVFNVMPSLFILGSAGCGKTRLTELITYFSRRGFLITNPTASNLPRIIEAYRPTLGIDDFDEIMRRHFPMIMSLLKHTYKNTVKIPRLEKTFQDSFILSLFNPFCPLVMNSTEPIRETQLFTRIIEIRLERKIKKFPKREPDVWYAENERKKLYKLRFLLAPKVSEIHEQVDTGLQGRDDEIWSPILAVAKLISNKLFDNIKNYAHSITRKKYQELYEEENIIIEAIENLLGEKSEIRFTASELSKEIRKILVDEREELTEVQFEKYWNIRRIGRISERMNIPQHRSGARGSRERVVTKRFLEKLKEEYSVITDNIDNRMDMPVDKRLSEIVLKQQDDIASKGDSSVDIPYLMSETSEMSVDSFSKLEKIVRLIGSGIGYADLENKAQELGIQSDDFSVLIDNLKKRGIVFEPKPGFIEKV